LLNGIFDSLRPGERPYCFRIVSNTVKATRISIPKQPSFLKNFWKFSYRRFQKTSSTAAFKGNAIDDLRLRRFKVLPAAYFDHPSEAGCLQRAKKLRRRVVNSHQAGNVVWVDIL